MKHLLKKNNISRKDVQGYYCIFCGGECSSSCDRYCDQSCDGFCSKTCGGTCDSHCGGSCVGYSS